jgi:hypothetical protein
MNRADGQRRTFAGAGFAALPGWAYRPLVNRRLLHTTVYGLIAALLLPGAPIVDVAAFATPAAMQAHCADMVPEPPSPSTESDPCPCCPEGSAGMASCFSVCMAIPGAVATLSVPAPRLAEVSPRVEVRGDLVTPADPPLKPPPIV